MQCMPTCWSGRGDSLRLVQLMKPFSRWILRPRNGDGLQTGLPGCQPANEITRAARCQDEHECTSVAPGVPRRYWSWFAIVTPERASASDRLRDGSRWRVVAPSLA